MHIRNTAQQYELFTFICSLAILLYHVPVGTGYRVTFVVNLFDTTILVQHTVGIKFIKTSGPYRYMVLDDKYDNWALNNRTIYTCKGGQLHL
jgi:hypothetical protein